MNYKSDQILILVLTVAFMTIPAQFDAKTIEDKWYDYWMKNNYFHSEPDHRTPYTIVIPPQMLLSFTWGICKQYDSRCLDKKSTSKFNACWVPGTDHASIATEAKVVAKLKAEGINKWI
jgi:valyl-tRNA synthetase